MTKRISPNANSYTIERTVQLLPATVDKLCDETAAQIEEAGRQAMIRAQELQDKLNALALAMREHSRNANEALTKYAADMKHTLETIQRLTELHQGDTILEAIEDHQSERLPDLNRENQPA